MTDDIKQLIDEITCDITYFKNMGFELLADKFTRDLDAITRLAQTQ